MVQAEVRRAARVERRHVRAADSGPRAQRLNSSRVVLITGAAGLIGSALARLLAARGHRVVACDDFSVGTWREHDERVVWEPLDVSAPDAVGRLDRHRPDVVVHGAAHPGGRSAAEPTVNVRVNALGSMQMFEWCARQRIPVVYLSSSVVYGDQPAVPIRESAPVDPRTVYAVCKVACERFLPLLGEEYGLPWTVLRLFATYGPGHRPGTSQGIVNVMLTQLMAGNRLVVRGSLDRVRDLVYVDDAAEAIAACLFGDALRSRVLNVGTGQATCVDELVTMLCRLVGRSRSTLDIVEEAPTPGDPFYNVADVDALRAATGFTARVSLDEGLARLVAARVGR